MYYLKPSFYDSFHCIADKCSYSCCWDWAIPLDEETCLKYINKGIDFNVDEINNKCTMHMKEDCSCCMLDENGLCKLVCDLGEDMLSVTCKLYPREPSSIGDRTELTLMNSCPYVLDLIKQFDGPLTFVLEETGTALIAIGKSDLQMAEDRNLIIDLLQISDLPLWARMYIVFHFVKKLQSAADEEQKEVVRKNINSVEYLLRLYEGLSDIELKGQDCLECRKSLFTTMNNLFSGARAWRRFCLPLMDGLDDISGEVFDAEYPVFEESLSEYDLFFENYVVNLVYNRACKTKDAEDYFLINIFSFVFEVAIIRFHLFCLWRKNNRRIAWEEIRDVCCYYARRMEHSSGAMHKIIKSFMDDGMLDGGRLLMLIK